MAAIAGISLADSAEFALAAAYTVALQRQATMNSHPEPTCGTTITDGMNAMRPSFSGWTSRPSGLSTEGFVPNSASTPHASDVAQNETLLSDLQIVEERTGRGMDAPSFTDVSRRSDRNGRVSTRHRASLRRSRSTQRTKDCTTIEQTLDDTNLATISQSRRLYRSLRSREYWENEYAVQSQLIRKVITGSFSRPAVVAYVMECWKSLAKTYSSVRDRPVQLQNVVHQHLVSAMRLLEFLIHRGYTEVSTLMDEFFNEVLGSYLRKPRHMHELCPAWVQSREILRIVCQTPTSVDVLFGLRATVLDIETAFLKTVTADVADRDLNFASYVLDQVNDLTSRINQRIQQIRRRKSFGLAF